MQQSAGVLTYLKDSVLSLVQQEPTMDLMPDTLSALSAVMLAQAQESIYLKAAKGDQTLLNIYIHWAQERYIINCPSYDKTSLVDITEGIKV